MAVLSLKTPVPGTAELFVAAQKSKSLKGKECCLQGNWGFDGSTAQAFYKQAFSDVEVGEDKSLLATTFIPLAQKTINSDYL